MNDADNKFPIALANFVSKLQGFMDLHYKDTPNLKPKISVDPNGKKYLRIVKDDGNQRSVYCFIDAETGNILKPGGWKAPEPKKHPRGNIYGENPLAGCGPYGVAYLR